MVGTKNGVGKQKRKTCVGFRIPPTQDHNGEKTCLTLEDKAKKKIWICDMACPEKRNIEAKRLEKVTK